MKKILFFSFIALFIFAMCGVSYAEIAGTRIGSAPRQSVMIVNEPDSHVHISTSPVDVWRITMTAESTTTYCHLINSATMGSTDTMALYLNAQSSNQVVGDNASNATMVRNVKADISAGVANDTITIEFAGGLRFDQGLLAGFSDNTAALTSQDNCNAVIEYSPVVN